MSLTAKHTVLLLLAGLMLSLPAWWTGPGGADLLFHGLWAREFAETLWSGTLYPRWLEGLYAGHGSPVFFFYPPLPHYIASLFYPLHDTAAFDYYPVLASATLAVMTSGLTCYLWLRQETADARAALMGAILYLLLPYHLFNSFLISLTLGELWAFTWLPLLLYFARRLADNRPYGLSGYAFTQALLSLSNLPATMILSPFALLYTLWMAASGEKLHTLLKTMFAILFAIALAAIYLLPAYFYQPHTTIHLHWDDAFGIPYHNEFLTFFSDAASKAGNTHTWLKISFLLTLMGLMLYGYRTLKHRLLPMLQLWFWLGMATLALFMTLPASHFLWEWFPVLQHLQFPSRFLIVPTLALSLLAALTLSHAGWKGEPYMLMLGLFALSLLATDKSRIKPDWFADGAYTPAHYARAIDPLPNYFPDTSVIGRFYPEASLKKLENHNPQIIPLNGNPVINVLSWESRHILLSVTGNAGDRFRIRQHDFPGWTATSHGKALPLTRHEATATLLLTLPQKMNAAPVTLTLTPQWPERIGQLVSGLALLLWMALLLYERRKITHAQA